jgi:phosphoribosylamine-glycine ligase
VLTVVGRGPGYDSAMARAYEASARISFDRLHKRTDIGRKALDARGADGAAARPS